VRTSLVDEQGNPLFTNRLVNEDSPYLLQHAHNPVDWYPWGDEAFDEARKLDKPVFLSIGYSTCHWCHVMEHESFDNVEIAEFLNEHFVCIKLDREQRPDLDDIYMTGVQMMSGQGGWPMSNFLTHEGHPFYAGTYYPPTGFMQLLRQLSEVWQGKRQEVLKQASEMSSAISQYTSARSQTADLGDDLTSRAAGELNNRLDTTSGGFGGAPKFPNESQLLVLIDDIRRNGSQDSLHSLTLTLDKMYQGGLYDQVAGGFHRYSVDSEWLVPHFEKMLYNQAQLLSVYSQAYTLTGEPAYRRIANEIGDYVLRDMSATDGGFFSATDADSEGEEGLFFVWTIEELSESLTESELEIVRAVYGVSEMGNFEGRNILNLNQPLKLDDVGLLEKLEHIKERLYEVREQRVHPLRDEKIITAWNGMMISALAIASSALQEPRFMEAACFTANKIWDSHVNGLENDDIDLWRVSLDGHVSIPGNLEDYACLAEALLRLYYLGSDTRYLTRGIRLVAAMNVLFLDEVEGGYFISRTETSGPMITRPKSPMDGATASGNSVALHALVLAHQLTGNLEFSQRANEAIGGFSGLIHASPSAFSYMVTAISDQTAGSREVIQFAAGGNVRVSLSREDSNITLKIEIAEGWHINANDVSTDGLIATEVISDREIGLVNYPVGEETKMPFSPSAINLYTGSVEIVLEEQRVATQENSQVQLRIQACDNSLCLAPELLTFTYS
jgi:uncharacterized protein YyaL (SSP411 family)